MLYLEQTTAQVPRHQVIEDRDIVGLKCAVLSRTQTPSLVVILLHGYGANRLDLATVAQFLLNHPELANNNVSQAPFYRIYLFISRYFLLYIDWIFNSIPQKRYKHLYAYLFELKDY